MFTLFNSERNAVEFPWAWIQLRLFQTTTLYCTLSLLSSAVNFDYITSDISPKNRSAKLLKRNTYRLLKLQFLADCMMMHLLKLYTCFHKFVYHLEFLKVFLNQYGQEKCISEIKKFAAKLGGNFSMSHGGEFSISMHLVADARNVQNRIMTHARAFEFDYTSSLAL